MTWTLLTVRRARPATARTRMRGGAAATWQAQLGVHLGREPAHELLAGSLAGEHLEHRLDELGHPRPGVGQVGAAGGALGHGGIGVVGRRGLACGTRRRDVAAWGTASSSPGSCHCSASEPCTQGSRGRVRMVRVSVGAGRSRGEGRSCWDMGSPSIGVQGLGGPVGAGRRGGEVR